MIWENRLAFSLIAVVALLAACGNGDTDNGDADGDAQQTDREAQQETDGEEANGETWTLQYSSHVDESNYHSRAFQWWAAEVEERTEGRVTFEEFYAASLCAFPEHVQCLSDGRIDLAIVSPLNHASELPIATMTTLPFESSHEEAYARAMGDFYRENDQFSSEWEDSGVKALTWAPVSLAYLGTTEPVTGLGDLEGMQVRGAGYLQQAVSAVGMNPVSMSFNEIYESLQRGVLDAWITSTDGAVSISLQEVTDHWVDLGTGNFTAIANPTMSKSVFDSMPAEIQEVIMEVSAELEEIYMSEFTQPGMVDECEVIMPEIESFEPLPEEDVEQWRSDSHEAIVDEWVSDMESAGVEGPRELLEEQRSLLEQYEANLEDVSPVDICNSM